MSGSSFTSDQVAFFKAFLADPELNEKWQAAENLYDSGGYIGSVSSLLSSGETVAGEFVQIRFPQAVALKSLRLQAGYGTSNVTYSAGVAINSLQSVSAVSAPTHTAFLFPGSSIPGETMIYEMTIDQADRLPFKILAVGGGGGGNTVHVTIHAMDGADVERVLVEQKETIAAIWAEQFSNSNSMRQMVRGA